MCVFVCVYALRIVSTDMILNLINALLLLLIGSREIVVNKSEFSQGKLL